MSVIGKLLIILRLFLSILICLQLPFQTCKDKTTQILDVVFPSFLPFAQSFCSFNCDLHICLCHTRWNVGCDHIIWGFVSRPWGRGHHGHQRHLGIAWLPLHWWCVLIVRDINSVQYCLISKTWIIFLDLLLSTLLITHPGFLTNQQVVNCSHSKFRTGMVMWPTIRENTLWCFYTRVLLWQKASSCVRKRSILQDRTIQCLSKGCLNCTLYHL